MLMNKQIVTDAGERSLLLAGLNPQYFPFISPLEKHIREVNIQGTRPGQMGAARELISGQEIC